MSPKTTEQYEEIRRRSSQSIKDVALELFAHKGFAGTSISEIAREAGVSKGLMYNYFDGKEALLKAIIADAMEIGERIMREHLGQASGPAAQLRGLTEATFDFIRDHFRYMKLLTALAFQPVAMEGMQEIIEYKKAGTISEVIGLFRQLGAGEPELEAYLYGGTLDGVLMHYLQMGEKYPLEEMKTYVLRRFNLI